MKSRKTNVFKLPYNFVCTSVYIMWAGNDSQALATATDKSFQLNTFLSSNAVHLQWCVLVYLQWVDFLVKCCGQEPGKRSQLWRMSSTGMLQHEGSSAPQDPHKSLTSRAASVKSASLVTYVLDIKDIALQPNREVPLTLRKPEERRRSTQIWRFKVWCSAFYCGSLGCICGIQHLFVLHWEWSKLISNGKTNKTYGKFVQENYSQL